MGDGHILAQSAHQGHLVGMDSMDDAAGSKEQAGLEHGMGEQVEHAGHVAQLGVIVEHAVMTRQTNTESHHHERNLRNRREGKHTLDVGLGTGNSSGIESREHTDPHDNAHGLGGILNPKREHAGYLEHTGNDHRGGVNESRHWRRTFHGVGQPDVKREHGTLTSTANEHQDQSRGQDEATSSNSFRHVACNERRGAVAHHEVGNEGEAE